MYDKAWLVLQQAEAAESAALSGGTKRSWNATSSTLASTEFSSSSPPPLADELSSDEESENDFNFEEIIYEEDPARRLQRWTECTRAFQSISENAKLKVKKLELQVLYLTKTLSDTQARNTQLAVLSNNSQDLTTEKHLNQLLIERQKKTDENYRLRKLLIECGSCRERLNSGRLNQDSPHPVPPVVVVTAPTPSFSHDKSTTITDAAAAAAASPQRPSPVTSPLRPSPAVPRGVSPHAEASLRPFPATSVSSTRQSPGSATSRRARASPSRPSAAPGTTPSPSQSSSGPLSHPSPAHTSKPKPTYQRAAHRLVQSFTSSGVSQISSPARSAASSSRLTEISSSSSTSTPSWSSFDAKERVFGGNPNT
jgi:hypothetical protein